MLTRTYYCAHRSHSFITWKEREKETRFRLRHNTATTAARSPTSVFSVKLPLHATIPPIAQRKRRRVVVAQYASCHAFHNSKAITFLYRSLNKLRDTDARFIFAASFPLPPPSLGPVESIDCCATRVEISGSTGRVDVALCFVFLFSFLSGTRSRFDREKVRTALRARDTANTSAYEISFEISYQG